jgi:hypothetical protein
MVESGGIFGTYRIFLEIVRQIGGIELFQRSVQVSGTVDKYAVFLKHHPGETLAELDVHIFEKRAVG